MGTKGFTRTTAKKAGAKGGLRGGPARAEALTKFQRVRIARKAAAARWKKGESDEQA